MKSHENPIWITGAMCTKFVSISDRTSCLKSSQTRTHKIGYYKPHIGLNFGRQQHWWDTYQISKWLKISKHESHLFKTLQYVTIRWLMKYWNHPCWSGSFATQKVNKAILSSYFFFLCAPRNSWTAECPVKLDIQLPIGCNFISLVPGKRECSFENMKTKAGVTTYCLGNHWPKQSTNLYVAMELVRHSELCGF